MAKQIMNQLGGLTSVKLGSWVLTEEEYQEYQKLKGIKSGIDLNMVMIPTDLYLSLLEFKNDAEREIKEIDESEWEVNKDSAEDGTCCWKCSKYLKPHIYHTKCGQKPDQETLDWNNPTGYHQPKDIIQQISTLKFNQDQIIGRQYDERDRVDVLEDRVSDAEGDINTLKEDLADSDYSTVKFMKSQRLINKFLLDKLGEVIDGQRELVRTIKEFTPNETGDGVKEKKPVARRRKKD